MGKLKKHFEEMALLEKIGCPCPHGYKLVEVISNKAVYAPVVEFERVMKQLGI